MSPNHPPPLGHLFMTGLPALSLDSSTRQLIADYGIGNFILFKRNIADPQQLRSLCGEIRQACHAYGHPEPLIAIDQEGGSVARLPLPFRQFGDARDLARAKHDALGEYARSCAKELLSCGINMNLAPVLDVCPPGREYIMNRRSLSSDPAQAAQLGKRVITIMQNNNLAACAKHFPGLGRATLDPHEALPRIDSSVEHLHQHDLPPFQAAISAKVAAIMTSHTIYSALDADYPATLSRAILITLLRQELDYNGVIITDDMEMGAIETHQTVGAASAEAFSAGADLLLICHDHDKVIAAHQNLADLVADDRISRQRLEASLHRIHRLQQRFAPKKTFLRESSPSSLQHQM